MQPSVARLSHVCCLLAVLTVGLRAELSEKIRKEISATLPKFDPRVGEKKTPESPVGTPASLADDLLVHLPDFFVREGRLPGNDPDMWLGSRERAQKAMAAYRESMTNFEWALNGWYIPLFGSPPSVRAKAYYDEQKLRDELSSLAHVVTGPGMEGDPDYAKKMLRVLDLGRHPED